MSPADPNPIPPPATDTEARIDELVNRRLDLLNDREKITARIGDIDDELLRLLPEVGGRRELYPGQGVRVQQPRKSFDAKKAMETLSPTQYQAICDFTPSSRKCRDVLGNIVTDAFMVTRPGSKPTIASL